jgi:hypothetical protein
VGAFPDRDPLELVFDLLAHAFKFRIIAERIVDKASVIRVERFGLNGAAVLPDGVGQLEEAANKGVIPHRAVMLNVDDDTGRFLVMVTRALRNEDTVGEELKALEDLFPPPDQALRFVGPDLEDEVSVTELLLDLCDKTEESEDGVQNFAGLLVHGS